MAKKDPWFWAFAGVAGILLIAMPLLSLDAGNSGDEDKYHVPHGNHVLQFFETGGKDTTCLSYENMKYYSSSFDVVIAFVNRLFHVDNIHSTRHIANALFGWLAILFAGLTAFRTGGWRAGVMAMTILFLSPRFLGHAYNNPKDGPFAAAIMMGCYFLLRFFQQYPSTSKKHIILLTLSIALAISIRVGGWILFGYFGVFGIAYLLQQYFSRRSKPTASNKQPQKRLHALLPLLRSLLLYAGGICLVAYFLGLVLWPFALLSPFAHPWEAFKEMSAFSFAMRQIFEGHFIPSNIFPWYYTPKYILLTIPLATLPGILLYPIIGGLKKKNRFATFAIYFTFLFPVCWIVYTNANVYGGWRHALFAYPPMAIAAGLGFNALAEKMKNKQLKLAFIALPFVLLAEPAIHMIRNHPYEYVYFNPLAGGINHVYGNYEMDYYYHSTREAAEWIRLHADKTGLETGEKIIVGSWHPASVAYFLRHDTARFQTTFTRWRERSSEDWDYAVFPITGMAPQIIKSAQFPPSNTVHTIQVDGKPICLILRRNDKSAHQAALLYEKAKDTQLAAEERIDFYLQAMAKYKQALDADPYDEFALNDLCAIYLIGQVTDSALMCLNKLTEYYPEAFNLAITCSTYEAVAKETGNPAYLVHAEALHRRLIADFPYTPQFYYEWANYLYTEKGDLVGGKKVMDACMKKNSHIFDTYLYTALYLAHINHRQGAIELLEKCKRKFPARVHEIQTILTPPPVN